ncbi:myb-like protein X [Zerene cesonia]|uniref:myb-like protein X n=1 Tax=Zerene cesonia TaxID=33412 RepID=UPI0018E59E6B|nr:myb-like protein X [Zerene cesonia]XP_038223615.1 myb-like protein X [Zerene cesonia]
MSSKSRIPSPARSHKAITPRRYKPRKSRSVGSPACSVNSSRLASVVKDVIDLSPMIRRRSVLNDDTDIIVPGRKSWWKNLDENSREVLDVLQNKEMVDAMNVLEDLDVEILSQGTKNYSLDLQDSSDAESIKSIVMPHRKLFSEKENTAQKKFQDIMKRRETLNVTEAQKSRIDWDKDLSITPKSLFKRHEKRPQPVFPAALLSVSTNKTVTNDKTLQPMEPKTQGRHLFGNRPATKRKNMFVDFIVSDSEEEIPDMQPKIFTLKRQSLQKRRASSISNINSPTASITDIEMDDWKLLPSSTMVEHQFEDQTTPKNIRRSIISGNNEKQNLTHAAVQEKQQQRERNIDKFMDIDTQDEADVTLMNNVDKETSRTLNTTKNRSNLSNRVSNKSSRETQHVKSHNNSNKVQNKEAEISKNNKKNLEQEESFRIQLKSVAKDLNRSNNKQNLSKAVDTDDYNKESNVEKNVQMIDMKEIQEESSDEELENSQLRYEEDEARIEDKGNKSEYAQKQSGIHKNSINSQESNIVSDGNSDNLHKTIQDNNISKMIEKKSKPEHNVSKDGKRKTIEKSNKTTEKLNDTQVTKENMHAINLNEAEQECEQKLANTQENTNTMQGLEDNSGQEKNQNENETGQLESELEQENIQIEDGLDNSQTAQQCGVLEDEESEIVEEEESEVDQHNDSHEDEEEQVDEKEERESEEEQEESIEDEEEQQQESELLQDQESETDQQESETEHEESQVEQEDDNHTDDAKQKVIHHSQNDDATNDKSEENQPSEEIANSMHDINTNINETVKSPEAVLNKQSIHGKISLIEGRNTSVRKTKSVIPKNLTIRPSLAPIRDSIEFSDGTRDSSANNSGWDSHRTTRKTMRQTFGKDFTPRKSLRTLVMEKSAKRQTNLNDNEEISKIPQANSTEYPEFGSVAEEMEVEESIVEDSGHSESDHEESNHAKSNHEESDHAELDDDESNHAESDHAESDHEESNHAESDHAESDNEESKHEESNHEESDREELSHAASNHEQSDHVELDHEESEHVVSDHEISDHAESDLEESAHVVSYQEISNHVVSDHEISKRTRQTTLETYLQKIKLENIAKKRKMEEEIRNSLKTVSQNANIFKVPLKPAIRRTQKTINKPKTNIRKPAIPLALLPEEVLEDLKYKPPKRYQPKNASWATKRLYKFLETKLEPQYDYKARVRAEKLVEVIYNFTRDTRRFEVAPQHSVDALKHEMARLNVVSTHFEFYEFIKAYMPREVRNKVVPDIVNKIPLPKPNVFAQIIR